jgi:hypothetical protein
MTSNQLHLKGFSEIPTWKIPTPKNLVGLAWQSKVGTNSFECKLAFLDLSENFPNVVRIFTDGRNIKC